MQECDLWALQYLFTAMKLVTVQPGPSKQFVDLMQKKKHYIIMHPPSCKSQSRSSQISSLTWPVRPGDFAPDDEVVIEEREAFRFTHLLDYGFVVGSLEKRPGVKVLCVGVSSGVLVNGVCCVLAWTTLATRTTASYYRSQVDVQSHMKSKSRRACTAEYSGMSMSQFTCSNVFTR
jgi:hypothetical protein